MKTEDPWDRIHDADRDPQPERDKFTKGEIACCAVFVVGVVGGIIIGAIKALSLWLELP